MLVIDVGVSRELAHEEKFRRVYSISEGIESLVFEQPPVAYTVDSDPEVLRHSDAIGTLLVPKRS